MDYYETIWMGLQWFSKMWQMIALAGGGAAAKQKKFSFSNHFHPNSFSLSHLPIRLESV